MRIAVVGGGPAGLYFALLMKKADRRHDITVIERNAPDATFGWGVVFSDETLGAFRDADVESYTQITDTFAKWNAIEVRYRGDVVRSRGHSFSAISRVRLLGILQARCRELGVQLQFFSEVDDFREFEDYDLVVAADGVHSRTRTEGGDVFKPELAVHRTKFVWFGADFAFRAFTFIFRETQHGLFQVHAYPFDADRSTFIVECPESAWQRAGLDAADEEQSIAFCEKLFADDLGGHRLLSNKSTWISFKTVRCETWHSGKVVLLGDAAHTAHFTIGSGTKLAMEDAIALARALQHHSGRLGPAFTDYEMERQPVVERFQEAAKESSAYFENVTRYARLDSTQFAFNLLTRSGRITYVNLALRDPQFVASVDRWFATAARRTGDDDSPAPTIAPPPMFAPVALGPVWLPNRVVVAPVTEGAAEGEFTDGMRLELTEAGRSGAGLVLTEMTAVSPEGRITPQTPGMYRRDNVEAWRRLVDEIHGTGTAKIALQLGHAGRRGSTRARGEGADRPLMQGGWPLVSASPIPYAPWSPVPKEMNHAEMEAVRRQFTEAAEGAREAGFDVLDLNFAHGYLPASFISPLANRRSDAYGGNVGARMRFPLEILGAVRAVWPPDRALSVAISATDWSSNGLQDNEAIEVAAMLKAQGVDVLRVLAGQTVALENPGYGRFYLVPFSDRIRNEVGIATIASGNLTTGDEVNTILAAGRADLCVLDAT